MIDNAIVKSAKARTRINSYIFNTELSQQVGRDVTAPLNVFRLLIAIGRSILSNAANFLCGLVIANLVHHTLCSRWQNGRTDKI